MRLCAQEGSVALVGLNIAAARFIATRENLKGLPGLALVEETSTFYLLYLMSATQV